MQIKIEEEFNRRLDIVVTKALAEEGISLTRSIVQENIQNLVRVNSKGARKAYRLKVGDILDLNIKGWKDLVESLDLSDDITPQKGELDIRYEDKDLLVIYKSKGITVHPGVGNRENTIANYIRYYLEEKGEYDNLVDRAGIVHRLDKGVSGLMVIAKSKFIQEFLKRQFQEHTVLKIYKAIVEDSGKCMDTDFKFYHGNKEVDVELEDFDIEAKTWQDWYLVEGYIGRSMRNRYKMEFRKYEWGNAKYAKSFIYRSGNEVLVKIETGRMHQIRSTLEYLGLRIKGDTLYGGKSDESYGSDNIQLEAVILSFLKPSGQKICLKTYDES